MSKKKVAVPDVAEENVPVSDGSAPGIEDCMGFDGVPVDGGAEASASAVPGPDPAVELAGRVVELEDKLLRLRAEYDNFRKRSSREVSDARISAKLAAMEPVLQVFDHFDMAVRAAEGGSGLEALRQGMRMILNEFERALADWGLERMEAVGERFDPRSHEAVAHEASETVAEGVVSKQSRCGYRLGERVVRPATVTVSSGPSAPRE